MTAGEVYLTVAVIGTAYVLGYCWGKILLVFKQFFDIST